MVLEPDQVALCDAYLPGRSSAELRALRAALRSFTAAMKRLQLLAAEASPVSDSVIDESRMLKTADHRAAVGAAEKALIERLRVLGNARLAMLPADATAIEHLGRVDFDDSDDRYKVVCITSTGLTVPLGGCTTLRDGEARAAWFRAALEQRRRR